MAEFTVNPGRHDPYKQFRFRVRWDGEVIPGISRVSALRRTTAPVTYRPGYDLTRLRVSPGITTYDPIVLERGVTHDLSFEAWANKVYDLTGQPETALATFRKDVQIDLLNEAGQLALSYVVLRAWPSVYEPITDLDAASSTLAREVLVLQHEGWTRDTAVAEPVEPK